MQPSMKQVLIPSNLIGEKNPGQCCKDTECSPMGVSLMNNQAFLSQRPLFWLLPEFRNYHTQEITNDQITMVTCDEHIPFSECQKHFCKTQGHIIHFIPRMIQLAINKITNLCCGYRKCSADFTVKNGPKRFWSHCPKG